MTPEFPNVLITGITGFAGSHLAELCLAEGCSVTGLTRGEAREYPNIGAISDRAAIFQADLADEGQIRRTLERCAPDVIFHLAAATAFHASPGAMFKANILGTLNLLEASASLRQRPTILVASSSAFYGETENPFEKINEDTPANPTSTYGLSKAAQDAIAINAGRRPDAHVVVARAFNHTGPRERPDFVASRVARQIASAELGLGLPRIEMGRVDTLRDFSDVRDIVRGYYLASMHGVSGEAYNFSSGRAVRIQTIVEQLLDMAAIKIEVIAANSEERKADVVCQIGDASKASAELGWEPTIPFDQTLADLLNYWRSVLSTGKTI